MGMIVGREKEKIELERLYQRNEPVFLALYGRRGAGKTFLINEFFKDRLIFKHTGVYSGKSKDLSAKEARELELEYFADSLRKHGQEIPVPLLSWREAFNELERLITNGGKEDRKAVFIDEMP